MQQTAPTALQGYCPVAYQAVGRPLMGSPEFATTHAGCTYHCVNAGAQREFLNNPDKYVPAYGGRCAFGMSIDKEFEPDPTNFKIIDGRLHLFLKSEDTDALALWNKEDEQKCRSNADKHWAVLELL